MSHPRLGDFINEGTNHSYYPLWSWPDLVKVIGREDLGVCQVQSEGHTHTDGIWYNYVLTCGKTKEKHEFQVLTPERKYANNFRRITFMEFLFYRDPNTKGRKIGKNRAWPLLVANGVAIYGMVSIAGALLSEGPDPWLFLVLGVCLGVPAITLIGTYFNYTGRWK